MKKVFTADTLSLLQYLSWPVLSADGKMIAYVQSKDDKESDSLISKICLYDRKNKCVLPWPCIEKESRRQPCFLPNGSLLYLSDRSGMWQLWQLTFTDMQCKQLTTARHGIVHYAVSDNGEHITFEATLWPEDTAAGLSFTEMDKEELTAWEKELDMRPYCVTELTYKQDEWYGMRKGEYNHVCTLTPDGTQRLIETNGMEAVCPAVSHDGKLLAFYGYPHSGAQGRQPELFTCGFDGDTIQKLTDNLGIYADHAPQFAHDDRFVVCAAYPDDKDGSHVLTPYRVSLADGHAEALFQQRDEQCCHDLHCIAANRTERGDTAQYFLLDQSDTWLYFVSSFRGYSNLYRVDIREKGKIEKVVNGESDIQAFSMLPDGSELIYLMANENRPAELYDQGQAITDVNGWLSDYALGKVEEHWCIARDGKTQLQYFLVYPVNYRKGQRVPAVLYVKDGPETIYVKSFWHQFQALANCGIAVVCPNPRGSVGFGRDFCANSVCWKKEAMEDHLDALNDAVAIGVADDGHLGVTGGGYGGYMTNKLIGSTGIFAAAVSQNGLVNPLTSYGTGDRGFISSCGVPEDFKMMTYLEKHTRGNIISCVDNMKVPLLILHSSEDYRCSVGQAEQLFAPMKERNPEVPVRLVIFQGENHSLARAGKLRNQQRYLSELAEWFDKYLMGTLSAEEEENNG